MTDIIITIFSNSNMHFSNITDEYSLHQYLNGTFNKENS